LWLHHATQPTTCHGHLVLSLIEVVLRPQNPGVKKKTKEESVAKQED
jgi:hypothetical protein